ncbi:MAG: germination protein YpeB [Ruminococcaceae bacterium]|nr:germination protein YpeB [Oscillospiraceae bacterium]
MGKRASFSRNKIRIILYTTTIILVLGIFSIVQSVKLARFEREVLLSNQLALVSLDENLNNISTNLEKVMYSSTPTMLSKLASELWRESSGAKNNLLMLPSSDTQLANTYKFLSQVGEFVMALGRKSASGESLSAEERQQLAKLYEYCNSLNEQVNQMCYELENGTFSFDDYDSTLLEKSSNLVTINSSFDDVEQSLSDLPSLIYDGPFSDHIEQGEALLLKGLKEISQDDALKVAQKVCENEKGTLEYSYEENGDIPCYVFKSENCTTAITKNGGYPLYMINSKFVGEVEIKQDEAVRNAKKYLEKIGYTNLKESYYYTDDGICTVNFASDDKGIVIYPDLIKVSVSLETGEVLSFDATGYVHNHHIRKSFTPTLTEAQAVAKINDTLEVIDTQLCIIPTDWKTEQYCYEIHCKTQEGQELLVYIDCDTGEEDNILILLYSDGGVLTK